MRIAILGTRGIPMNYGGFETFAQELSTRLAAKGNDVSVYCRKGNSDWKETHFQGVRLITLPTIRHKYFDTIAHTFISVWHVAFTKTDIVYICNSINSPFALIPRLFGKKVIINVDGLEWKRAKWNGLGKWAYRVSERIATNLAHVIISDSKGIAKYYMEKYNKETIFIPYGATRIIVEDSLSIIQKYNLTDRGYFLYVSRLEPENNAHLLIEAYEKLKTDMPLAIVGSAPYGKPYINRLRQTQDKRIRFLGAIYGDGYRALQSHAFAYIHGNEVGGTNPALLEAMASGNCVIAHGVSFNREVVADAGCCFKEGSAQDLGEKMKMLLEQPSLVEGYRKSAPLRIEQAYNWNAIVNRYEALFREMLGNNKQAVDETVL